MPANDRPEPTERLAAVLAADAVGFSRLMHDDERATLATLDEFRGVFRQCIERYRGRIVDMAGDSILAVFDSATAAVNAAQDAQRELGERNAALPAARRLWFRVGINLGDILVKDDGSIYGDGVNVAARLQSMANAGGVNLSGSVFDSVRAKVAGPFTFLGEHALKNIAAPVEVYRLDSVAGGAPDTATPDQHAPAVKLRPSIAVMPLQLISGGDEVGSLASGLYQDILNGLTRQTALDVIGGARADEEALTVAPDFQLEGSIRAAGDRLRLSFTLVDTAARRQLWSERYDRQMSDIFDLEDEISRAVSSAVRLRIKAGAFEKLRNTPNAQLSVQELLSKAAGFFVDSYGHNAEVTEILDTVLSRAPDNSMAHAMAVFCRHRAHEFSARALPPAVIAQMREQSQRALSLDHASYFAQLIAAVVQQDVCGNFNAAMVHADDAFNLNPGFSTALAMVGIAKIHLGEVREGLRLLQNGIDAAPEDPHRFRHLRELALGQLIDGDAARAAQTVERLLQQAPELLRNEPVAAALLWQAGRETEAAQRVSRLLTLEPDLTLGSMRPIQVGNPAVATAINRSLRAAGLPA